MAPGPDGRLYVSIPREGGADGGDVIALLDNTGTPSPGWPLRLLSVYGCDLLLPVADASVRVVCDAWSTDDPGEELRRVFAFDANGQSLPGWPVDIGDGFTGRMIGEDLTTFERTTVGDGDPRPELWRMLVVRADGTIQRGVDLPLPGGCGFDVGPDGTGWCTAQRDYDTSVKTDVAAFGLDGPRAGWPVTFDSNASSLAFDATGLAYMVVGAAAEKPNRTVVLDRDGLIPSAGSGDLAISPTTLAHPDLEGPLAAPTVADDGTAFIVGTEGGRTTVTGISPAGQPLVGWPYRSTLGMQRWPCEEGETPCGSRLAARAIGSDNVLYLLHSAASRSTGGSIVAIRSDGRVRAGWPVGLRRAGSMFWSMAVNPSGGVWALAIEPEKAGYSATILAIAEDSTVRYSATIVQP